MQLGKHVMICKGERTSGDFYNFLEIGYIVVLHRPHKPTTPRPQSSDSDTPL